MASNTYLFSSEMFLVFIALLQDIQITFYKDVNY